MNIKPLLLTLGALTTASSVSGCTVHSAKPSYTLRHSNLGDAGDMKRVVVTESKTRFWGTAILAAAGLITPAFLGEELSGNGLVVGAFTGLMFDISTTYLPWGPYVETQRLYDCKLLLPEHHALSSSSAIWSESSTEAVKDYLSALRCNWVSSNPPWEN
jgi:hypothetical protein